MFDVFVFHTLRHKMTMSTTKVVLSNQVLYQSEKNCAKRAVAQQEHTGRPKTTQLNNNLVLTEFRVVYDTLVILFTQKWINSSSYFW